MTGIPRKIPKNEQVPRIIGGQEARVNQIPWQIGLVRTFDLDSIFCGGTIIGPSTILTAAHCLNGVPHPDNVTILVAEHDITTSNETNRK